MCYSVEAATLKKIKYAIYRGDTREAEGLQRLLEEMEILKNPLFYVSGFEHPQLLVFTNEQPFKPQAFSWGLIPAWVKSLADAKKTWNTTLNARGESIFEKASFRTSAQQKRCLIYVDAFYEHHHANKKTYPFRIALKNGDPMALAGLWEEWLDKSTGEIFKTCAIVTTEGNALMQKIHNNPKAEGPRMPVILPKEKQDDWLMDCKTEADKKQLQDLLKPLNDNLLEAHTVAKLLGKEAIGNVKEVELEVKYPDLAL